MIKKKGKTPMALLQRLVGIGFGLGLVAAFSACAPDVILEGTRFDVRTDLATSLPTEENPNPAAPDAALENRTLAIALPGAQNLSGWPQRGGTVRHDSPHGALSAAPVLQWAVNIGPGNSRQNRIAAAPVVADGRVFVLDSNAGLSAVSTAGALLWQTSLTPDFDTNSALSGGGLSVDGGTVFATSPYGEVIALDAATGGIRWRQKLDAAISGAPLAAGGAVYAAARDGSVWALGASDGRILWTEVGNRSPNALLGSGAPTLGEGKVFFPLSSGEVLAFGTDGTTLWSAAVTGQIAGRAYSNLSDLTGDPVLSGGTLFVGSASGTTAAIDAETGARIWTAPQGALNAPLVVGGSVFVVTSEARLVRLDSSTGAQIWDAGMPNFVNEKPKKRQAVFAHFGPVLAGGRVAVASGDGVLRLFDAAGGALVGTAEIPGGAAAAPALAGGQMFIVTGKGQLLAFR